ncbi:hypothetical protein MCG98_05360 [Ruminococcus sp. OA3]|uniref:hypothetical protein n=1 Tax=Ruminococcus sp. OA3 TaxID=2914164 RepID=UPI001F05D545|nr:hypothetical protein [Ruminococcus sp. OA3]MCH1981989.1 hypothetical protein [Ruminococcus sp. OA3]
MDRRRQFYRVCFDCSDEFIIVPVKLMRQLLAGMRTTDRLGIAYTDMFPDGYTEYLIRVLNSNRHLPQFAYRYIREIPIRERDIIRILVRQLQSLKVNGVYCFAEIRYSQCSEKRHRLDLKYTPGLLRLQQETDGIFYYEPSCTL